MRRTESKMKVEKKKLGTLEKCYCVQRLVFEGKEHLLIAAEKQDACQLFNIEGEYEETIWEQPGGTMSMVQVPESDGVFLATHKFYSPNDSKEAKIVCVSPENHGWNVNTIKELPFVHRFDILKRNGVQYLIACTIKSDHQYKEDWTSPGKVYAGVLPSDLSSYSEENQVALTVIQDGMTKNHGYYKVECDGQESAIISCQEGIFRFTPPVAPDKEWEIKKLLDVSASDAVLMDLDGDGKKELIVIAPFHGEQILIYKEEGDTFEKVYECEEPLEFAHAICGGIIGGRPAVVIGHRKGKRNLYLFFWDAKKKKFVHEVIDEDCGSANVIHFKREGKDFLVATNREINEIAMYQIGE